MKNAKPLHTRLPKELQRIVKTEEKIIDRVRREAATDTTGLWSIAFALLRIDSTLYDLSLSWHVDHEMVSPDSRPELGKP